MQWQTGTDAHVTQLVPAKHVNNSAPARHGLLIAYVQQIKILDSMILTAAVYAFLLFF